MCKYCVILYKGLEHLCILVSAGGPGTSARWIPRDNCTLLADHLQKFFKDQSNSMMTSLLINTIIFLVHMHVS